MQRERTILKKRKRDSWELGSHLLYIRGRTSQIGGNFAVSTFSVHPTLKGTILLSLEFFLFMFLLSCHVGYHVQPVITSFVKKLGPLFDAFKHIFFSIVCLVLLYHIIFSYQLSFINIFSCYVTAHRRINVVLSYFL